MLLFNRQYFYLFFKNKKLVTYHKLFITVHFVELILNTFAFLHI